MVGYCVLDSTLNPTHGGGLGGKKLDNVSGTDTHASTSARASRSRTEPLDRTG